MDTGQHIEERGLARTVRTDDADDLAFMDIEIDGLQRMQAAEILAQSAHLQQRRTLIGRLHERSESAGLLSCPNSAS